MVCAACVVERGGHLWLIIVAVGLCCAAGVALAGFVFARKRSSSPEVSAAGTTTNRKEGPGSKWIRTSSSSALLNKMAGVSGHPDTARLSTMAGIPRRDPGRMTMRSFKAIATAKSRDTSLSGVSLSSGRAADAV